MKKLVVDPNLCIGCGTCVSLCPKVFQLGDEGKAEVVDQNADSEENINNAVNNCPVQAIGWVEE